MPTTVPAASRSAQVRSAPQAPPEAAAPRPGAGAPAPGAGAPPPVGTGPARAMGNRPIPEWAAGPGDLDRSASLPGPPVAPDPAVVPSAPRSSRGRWATVAVITIVVVGLAVGYGAAWGLVIGFAVAWPLERVFRRHEQPVRRPGLRTDVVHFLFTHLLQGAALLAAAAVCWVPLHLAVIPASRDWLAARPPAVVALLALLLFEVGAYAQHRAAHAWAWLWRFHAVHHSSEHLDWLAASRLHPVEGFVGGFFLAPAVIVLGFPVASLGLFTSFTTVWAILIHANVDWRLRGLDRIFPTPEYHHWHHSNEPDARDRNFGLPLLDLLFGTWFMPAERRPARYGIDGAMPDGWFAQLAHPFRRSSPSVDGPGRG